MAVDESSSSLSFREVDDVFLQSQARIWLGEVLHTRFDEQLSIRDLLSDGELLFEVSKALWNMLLVKYMELNNFKARMLIPIDTRKSSGRYRPYSNVDSFFKICKVLGLSGVDLFSPSDVVEKKDTRKVCICIRSLSKKARSKQLNVPDFDIVTKTVAMPTDVVRCIRRSLELSTSSITHGQSNFTPRLKSRQKSSFASHKQEDESYFEESDEEKSNYSDTSYANFLYLESGESHNTVDKYALTHELQQADNRNQEIDKFSHAPGSAESLLLQYVSNDHHVDGISSPVCESRLIICDEFTPIKHGAKCWHDNGENAPVPHNRGEVVHHISLSDTISFRIFTNFPFHISEDCLCQSCMDTESHDSNTTPNSSLCRIWRKFPGDLEASPTSSVSSVVGRVLDFDFDAKSEPNDLRTLVFSTPNLQQHGSKRLGKLLGLCKESEQEVLEQEVLDLTDDSFSPCWDDGKSCCSVDQDLESLNQSDIGHGNGEDRTKTSSKDEREDDNIECLAEANTNGKDDKRTVKTEKKSTYIAPLLKTVAKGTALIGVLFLLHIRIMGYRNTNNKSSAKSSQIHWKSSGVVFSRRKGENGSKIYPIEKLL